MARTKRFESFDDSFYKLAADVTRVLDRNENGSKQPEQVGELLAAEKQFKEEILRHKKFSREVYKRFLQKICVTNKNILSARPYFRESAITFSKHITPAIKSGNIDDLKKFNINFQLINFIRNNWIVKALPVSAEAAYQRVIKARGILIENNMPLAINRAKLFYRKTPRSHLSLMDLIGICSMGLAAGIDKYVGEYTPVFRSVCIGRMVGNMIDSYSETMLHFYPSDKRILYKAHTIRGRRGISEVDQLASAVNKSFKDDAKEGKSTPKNEVSTSELSTLMNAASTVSADAIVNEEGFGVYQYTQDTSPNAEEMLIERTSMQLMLNLAKNLPLLHRKILALKGIKS